MAQHNEFGSHGEELAAEFLSRNDYQILQTNWHAGKLEIDLIVEKNNVLIFVEVKTRKNAYFGPPEKSVTRKKQKLLFLAANLFLKKHPTDKSIRFDIVSITGTTSMAIKHIENAFYPLI